MTYTQAAAAAALMIVCILNRIVITFKRRYDIKKMVRLKEQLHVLPR